MAAQCKKNLKINFYEFENCGKFDKNQQLNENTCILTILVLTVWSKYLCEFKIANLVK